MTTGAHPSAPAERYAARAAEEASAARRCRERSERTGWLRIVAFVVMIVALVAMATTRHAPVAPWVALFVLSLIAFVALVSRHRRIRDAMTEHEQGAELYRLALRRMDRDWDALPPMRPTPAAEEHPYASDLDVVGHASLVRLLDVAGVGAISPTLLRWLLVAPPGAREIRERQGAARELAGLDDLREALALDMRLVAAAGPWPTERLLAWCELPPRLASRTAMVAGVRAITALTLLLLALQIAGLVVAPWWALSASAGLALLLSMRRAVRDALPPLELRVHSFRRRVAMLARIEETRFDSPRLDALRARLLAGGAARELSALARLSAWGEVRYSPMLHAVLQWLLQWDVHLALRLERWRARAGGRVRDWFAALDEVEALVAVGTLAHENPGWAMPDITDAPEIEGEALAHPLLPPDRRVANDVTVGPPGTFLLVTGSNMSGKSTLLRAIGTNVLLARAGSAVCAARLRLPVLEVRTSIRVADSLERGISLFMAELRRLKAVVDAARDAAAAHRPLLYLLDEILHGTNSAERRIAARIVIGELVAAGAIGAVTTHDLGLAADGELRDIARPVHFSEQFDRVDGELRMTFDYRLRPGLATSTNALALLRMVGLDPGPPPG